MQTILMSLAVAKHTHLPASCAMYVQHSMALATRRLGLGTRPWPQQPISTSASMSRAAARLQGWPGYHHTARQCDHGRPCYICRFNWISHTWTHQNMDWLEPSECNGDKDTCHPTSERISAELELNIKLAEGVKIKKSDYISAFRYIPLALREAGQQDVLTAVDKLQENGLARDARRANVWLPWQRGARCEALVAHVPGYPGDFRAVAGQPRHSTRRQPERPRP